MIPAGTRHICNGLKHPCSLHTGGDREGWRWLCCHWCELKCDHECFNDTKKCGVHEVVEVPQPKRNPPKRKSVVVYENGIEVERYTSITDAIGLRYKNRPGLNAAIKRGEAAIISGEEVESNEE